ncbi:hypothetical protein [Sodalis-like endosymbiont of Proechinophthirus fluctus]|nr:hypothetical protein [Sodalis-like endosymbiont of Proechinophthirus fluctus]
MTSYYYFPDVIYENIVVRDLQGKVTFTKDIPDT